MRLAAYGCSLLDREAAAKAGGPDADKAAVAAEIESLKRWCAAHVHDPALSRLGRVPVPENLDYDHLVQIQRPGSGAAGGDRRARREAAPPRRLQADRQPLSRAARC